MRKYKFDKLILTLNMLYHKENNQKGAAAVEFAIIAIIFIILIFAIIEFGILMYNKQIITNAAREGARHGIVFRPEGARIPISDTTDQDTGQFTKGIDTVVLSYCENFLISFGTSEPEINISRAYDDNGTEDIVSNTACELPEDFLIVELTYDYEFLFIPLATTELSSIARMRCE